MISLVEKNVFSHPFLSRLGDGVLVLCMLLAGTALPRLILSGDSPKVDEGEYAFAAQWIHHGLVNGQGIPDSGGLSLYPMLVSWVFYFNYNPIVAVRLVDLCVAVLTSFIFYSMLKKESGNKLGAVLITLIFTYTMNQFVFIESGFKNSIMAAFVPLFLAIRIGQQILQEERSKVSNVWWMAGALTALAVILREPFVSFAVLGLITVFVARGWKAALRFFLGGTVAGVLVIGGILLARGGITETLLAYRDAGIVFGAVPKEQIMANFFHYGLISIIESSVALSISALSVSILIWIIATRQSRRIALNFLFWLAFIGVALIEPATKFGAQYHFVMTLPGFAGICALALRKVAHEWPNLSWANKERRDAIALLGVMLSAIWLSSGISSLVRNWWPVEYWPATFEMLATAPDGVWPDIFGESPFLVAAEIIKKTIPVSGTVSVNRNMHILHPLTGHLPPSNQLVNLSSLVFRSDFSVSRIKEALMGCAPDIMLIILKDDWLSGNGNSQLLTAIKEVGFYKEVIEISFFDNKNATHATPIILTIYRKTKETACLVS
jgi:hypothetical protein